MTWHRTAAGTAAAPVVTEAEIRATIRCGLLAWPYFALTRGGVPVTATAHTVTRTVLDRGVPGFLHRGRVLDEIERGATLRLLQPEDWHPGLRSLVDGVAAAVDGPVRSALVLAAPGDGGPEPAGADLHVHQMEGTSVWTLGAGDRVPLGPGDVLSVPAGLPRHGVADGGTSLHALVSVLRPTAADLVEACRRELTAALAGTDAGRRHHLMTARARAEWVRDQVVAFCESADPAALLATAGAVVADRAARA